jgi:outer membrane protein OmpA-like peptidoglycan-associated protein
MNKTSFRLKAALLAATMTGAIGGAASAQTDGWYVGGEAGVTKVPGIGFNDNQNSWHQKQDLGYGVLGQAGYGFGPVRVEGELGFRRNNLSTFSNADGDLSPDGSIGGVSGMANIYYDFNTGTRFTPYLGGGIGGLDLSTNNIKAGGVGVSNDNRIAFAYQGIAGISYAVDEALSIKADYRYLRTADEGLAVQPSYGGGNASAAYASHAIMIGFTYKFPAPKPAVVHNEVAMQMPALQPVAPAPTVKPVVAAPVAKSFMLFFDWDKSDLSAQARSIIQQAADNAKKNHTVVIRATGYTDLSGTEPYNLKLSVRRGEAVKAMLVAQGIPADEISVVGKGKSDPLVQTQDGVREAQNRRVVITLE